MRQLRVLVPAAFALGFASATLAQSYPAKPVKIVIPFPPVTAGLIVVAESPEYFGEVIRNDYAKYGKLVRSIGFQPQ